MRTFLASVLFVMAFMLESKLSFAQDACNQTPQIKTDLGRALPLGLVITPGQLDPKTFRIPGDLTRYFRALIAIKSPLRAKWQLTIRDSHLRPLEAFSWHDTQDQTTRWTRRLDGRSPTYFDLMSDKGVEIEIRQVIVMPESAQNPYYSVQTPGSYGFIPLENADTGRRFLGDYVGVLMSSWDRRSWCCSGVAVDNDLFLTNWHCGGDSDSMTDDGFWSADVCANTIIDMSWDGDSVDREYVCTGVVEKSKAKDFALLRVKPRHGEDSLRVPTIRRAAVIDGEGIIIVHHPACRPKQISLNCSAKTGGVPGWVTAEKSDFTHNCDTEGGSSGGAVFDLSNKLVGIHHLPFERKNGICDKLNKGVGIDSIIRSISEPNKSKFEGLVQ
jgi:hypothetical protein